MNGLSKKKLLLFGGAGQVGTAVQNNMAGLYNILAPARNDFNVHDRKSIEKIVKDFNPEVVLNCIAIPSIELCEEDPVAAYKLHCEFVATLALLSNENDYLLMQPSSHAIFDGLKKEPYEETDIPKATSVYAATKLVGEYIVKGYCNKFYNLRFPSLFGPRKNKTKGFFDKVIDWLNTRDTLHISKEKFDSPTYSFDVANGIHKLISNDYTYGTYHLCNVGFVNYYEFVVLMRDMIKSSAEIIPVPESYFGSTVVKPKNTALKSNHIVMRNSFDAMEEFLKTLQ